MKTKLNHGIRAAVAAVALSYGMLAALAGPAESGAISREKEEEEAIVLSPFCVTSFGATPGGAKDINFFRTGVGRGDVPHPGTITAEGLFSQHDLPLHVKDGGDALFFVQTAATEARFEVLPDVRYLAQLGLGSGLKPDTWKRAPLNLVAVVDKSGSMSGQPLALVRASLTSALGHLREGDQIAIVLYGDTSHVFLEPTVVDAASRGAIGTRIAAIESAGSTAMEAGLRLGYDVARRSAATFSGTTRVMLFTDERPNVGNTEAAGFVGMAEAASRDGIGLTTVGVGVQFGAELARRISSVRGGNLLFFPDAGEMKRTFAEDFDMLVTELAHDFTVRLEPAAGLRIAGVFGVPGDMLRWDGDAITLDVATIFLSKRKGAIYFALAPVGKSADLPEVTSTPGAVVAHVGFSYARAGDGVRDGATEPCRLLAGEGIQDGLRRGVCLVDEYLSLRQAATLHLIDNDQEAAFQLMHGLVGRLIGANDPALAAEVELATGLHNTLALLAGRTGEMQSLAGESAVSPLVGVWRQSDWPGHRGEDDFLIVWPNGVIELIGVERRTRAARTAVTIALEDAPPRESAGQLSLAASDDAQFGAIRFSRVGETLRLEFERFDGDGAAQFLLQRSSYGEIPMREVASDTTELDAITGLPAPTRSGSESAGAIRPRRRGVVR